jgi:UDP-N-acetylmuramate--alanine ligase
MKPIKISLHFCLIVLTVLVGIQPAKSQQINWTHLASSAASLQSYSGIYRRTQLVGTKNGISVIDDFAHNPSEVTAALMACQQIGPRVFAWFQPHGFGPLRFMHKELAERVTEVLRKEDQFIMSDVYYAGGTVNRDIGPEVVINAIQEANKNALLVIDRSKLPATLSEMTRPGDIILLMGARDPSLSDFAVEVLEKLPGKTIGSSKVTLF